MRSLLALLVLAPLAARADVLPTTEGPSPLAIAQQMFDAIGGNANWQKARYFRYDWIVEREGKRLALRSHYWDRWSGRYRVEGVDDKGTPYAVYFNVNTRAGDAWLGGKKVSDAAQKKKWLDDGYEAFINDSYWLLAPFKVFDGGVTLGYDRVDKAPSGETCDVIKLSFQNVGLTPKDVYWLYISQKSHLVVAWKFVLDGDSSHNGAYAWSDWKKVGPIMVSSMRKSTTKPSVIRFDNLKVSTDVDEAALTPPK